MNVALSRSSGRALSRLALGARWPYIALGALLAVNLIVTALVAANHLEPFADLAIYYEEAQMINQGHGPAQPIQIDVRRAGAEAPYPTADRFLFPVLIAIGLRLAGDSLAVANVVAALSMSLTALPLYVIGRKLFSPTAALLACALYTLNPYYHVIGVQAWTDLTASFFAYACLAALVVYDFAPSGRAALLCGTCFALATLTREEALLLAFPLLFVWWWRGRRPADGILFALAPAIGLGWRAWYLYQTFGSPFYTERAYFWLPRWPLWYYLGTFTPQEYLDYVGGIGGMLAIRAYNILNLLSEHFSDGLFYFNVVGIMPLAMLVAIVAALKLGWPQLTRERRALLTVMGATLLLEALLSVLYLGYIDDQQVVRHGSHASLLLLLIGSAGLVALWQHSRRARVVAALVLANYGLFSLAYFGAWGAALSQPVYHGPIVLASEWARAHLPDDAVLMTRSAAEAYYFSGKPAVVTPSGPFADTMDYARAHRVTHFIVTDVERSGAPNLLQGIRAAPRNFQTVYATEGAQIIAVRSYDLPPAFSLPNELYAGKTVGRPAALLNWGALAPQGAGSIAGTLVSGWSDVFGALVHPVPPPVPRGAMVNLRAGDQIMLLRYDLASGSIARGDELQVALHWRALTSTAASDTVFVHLLDSGGVLRAQVDAQPLGGTHPTNTWAPDEYVEDHYHFVVPNDLPEGMYQLEIGLYDSGTGARLPLVDSGGQRLAEDRLLIQGLVVK